MVPRLRPNILFITDDQHRFDFFGDTGVVPALRTPNLDRLRAEGTTLNRAYSNCPICMPTRFTWNYGLYASQAARRLMQNHHAWPTHLPSMPQCLQHAGYHTAVIGKVHSHSALTPPDLLHNEYITHARGFDDVFEVCGKSLAAVNDCRWTRHLAGKGLLERYRQDVLRRNPQVPGGAECYEPSFLSAEDYVDTFIGDHGVRWLEQYDDPGPFYLHVSFCGPHFPLDPPQPYFGHYRPEDMPAPVAPVPPDAARRMLAPTCQPVHGRCVTDPRHWQMVRALHCGMIELIDEQIGRLLDVLEDRKLDDNTLVIFTTDHGDMLGDQGLYGKNFPYEASCRTPITARWPGIIPAARMLDSMVETVDLPCTILDVAGIEGGASSWLCQTPGRSFLSYLTGEQENHRDWAYSECDAIPLRSVWRMCCEKNWKYIFSPVFGEQLFDIANDPNELHNLIDRPEYAEHLGRLRVRLIESLSACVAPSSDPAVGP